MREFKNIRAWQLADKLVLLIYQDTKSFPKGELYGITSQIRRAAVSEATNIAEGSARRTVKDYLQFLYIANGSLREVECLLLLSLKLNYLSNENFKKIEALRLECIKTLQGLIIFISKDLNNS